MATKFYPVLSPLSHDGEEYAINEKVEMDVKLGEPLVEAGVLGEGKSAKAEKTDSPKV